MVCENVEVRGRGLVGGVCSWGTGGAWGTGVCVRGGLEVRGGWGGGGGELRVKIR